jgi:hypothetical protein
MTLMGCSTIPWRIEACPRQCATPTLSKPLALIWLKPRRRRRAVPTSDQAIDGAVSSSMSSIFGRPVTALPSSVSCINAWMLLVTVGYVQRLASIRASSRSWRASIRYAAKALTVAASSSSTARVVTASLATVL